MIKRIAFVGQPTRDLEREICRVAVILDTEGNPIMLHQHASWRD